MILIISCKSENRQQWEATVQKEISERYGKELYLVDSVLIVSGGNVDEFYLSQLRPVKRIVMFIDVTCSACLNNFSFWDKFIKEAEEKKIHCEYLIYLNIGSENIDIIRKLDFNYPILMDSYSKFIEKNNLWDKRFQTALLNEKNEVIIIGDPTVNEKLKDLYMNTLLNQYE